MNRNILILSAGTRNKIVQYYKKELAGRGLVVATDASPYAPALYEADAREIVPMITDPGYVDRILEIVRKYRISGCFSLIDPELSIVASRADDFRRLGCEPMISPFELVETSLHKMRMARCFEQHGLKTPRCFTDKDQAMRAVRAGELSFPLFVKPEDGSASLHINLAEDEKQLDVLLSSGKNMLIQERMTGPEYGADVYLDMISGRCVSIFLKKKLKMRAGETDKAVSVHDAALFEKIAAFTEACGFRGQIDIDLFLEDEGFYFSEVNPRYGGGYPHAYECGVRTPAMYLANLDGIENPVRIGEYEDGFVMMKYNEVMVRREDV